MRRSIMHWKTIILTVAATIAAVAFVATQHYPEFSDQARGDIAELISVEADTPAVIITPRTRRRWPRCRRLGDPAPAYPRSSVSSTCIGTSASKVASCTGFQARWAP